MWYGSTEFTHWSVNISRRRWVIGVWPPSLMHTYYKLGSLHHYMKLIYFCVQECEHVRLSLSCMGAPIGLPICSYIMCPLEAEIENGNENLAWRNGGVEWSGSLIPLCCKSLCCSIFSKLTFLWLFRFSSQKKKQQVDQTTIQNHIFSPDYIIPSYLAGLTIKPYPVTLKNDNCVCICV